MTQMPKTDDQTAFENAIRSLEAQAANIGAHVTIDATARQAYSAEIKSMGEVLRRDASSGRITWAKAAKEAQETRNLAMEAFRLRSTAVGRSLAEKIKPKGYSLNYLVEQKAIELFGEKAVFARMTISQKNRIYAAIVASASTSNKDINTALARLSFAGRGVLILSVGCLRTRSRRQQTSSLQ